ncbi:MAG: ABC transporter substrate-binding protein [Bacillota bacterium]
MKKLIITILILSLLCLTFSGCEVSESSDVIRIGYHTNYGGSGTVLTAVEKGYFEDQGLEVELVSFASGASEIAALYNGTIDFAYIGQGAHSLVIGGMAEIVCTQNISDSEAIIVNKNSGIETVADLKGKTIAVLFGTSSEDMVNIALASVGLSQDDVVMKNYDMSGAVTALSHGSVDAICVWEEYRFEALDALGKDGVTLATTGDYSDVYAPLSSWVATGEYIQENEETVQLFVNAVVKAQNYWSYNTEETCDLISDELGISLVNLLKGKDMSDIFSIKELKEYLESGYITQLYQMQQDYLISAYEGIEQRDVEEYLHLEYMQNAVG